MTRRGVARSVILGVNKQIGGGHELIGYLPGKHAIETLQNISRRLHTRHDGLHGHLHHKCGWDAVPRDVGYQDTKGGAEGEE